MSPRRRNGVSIIPGFLVASAVGVAGLQTVTQFLAAAYGDAAALGSPIVRNADLPFVRDIYALPMGLEWLLRIDSRCLARSLHHLSCDAATLGMLRSAHAILAGTVLASIVFGTIAGAIAAAYLERRRETAFRRTPETPNTNPGRFQLVVGQATGRLLRIGHGAGVPEKTSLVLRGDDASQNIAIFGGIGSGKTTRGINRLVAQALSQQCGILAFDIKGDYYETLRELARRVGRPIVTIGVRAHGMNLLEGLTPEVAASFLKSALLLGSGADSKFWIETGTELARNVLSMLRFLPEAYSLNGLYRWLFDESERERLSLALQTKLDSLTGPENAIERRLLLSSLHYYRAIFIKFDDKVRSNVLAELAQVLSPFAQPDLADAFCTSAEDNVRRLSANGALSEALKMSLARYASIGGRARRSEYWYFTLFHSLAVLLSMVVSYLAMLANPALAIILYSFVIFGTLLPHLAVSIRRLHDVNRSGWWYLFGLVPLLGTIVLLVWFCTDGTRGPNRFGADPKGTVSEAGSAERDQLNGLLS